MQRRIPWTERFRPRSLSEVILTRSQRNTIINWWRAWVCLWNLKVLWMQTYYRFWTEFLADKANKRFWRTHQNSWYEFFLSSFEKWISSSNTQSQIFEQNSIADVKKTAKPILEKFLERTWTSYLSKKKIERKNIPIPPLPPYKPLLLVGPPGSGKTTTAYALANDEGVYVIEFNASDERSKSAVDRIIREASKSSGFLVGLSFPQKPPRLLLLDEVDGLSAQRDKGGFRALVQLLKDIKIPPILTANVIHDPKIRQLMVFCVTVFFDRPQEYQAKALIKRIAKAVNMSIPEEIINRLAKYAPDFRSIVVALETYYYSGRLPSLWHDRMASLQDAIRFAFGLKSRSGKLEDNIDLAKRYLQESGEDIVDLILTAWENAWNFIRKDGIFGFYKAIADADYYYRIGALKGNWRVAYINASNALAYAMAKYGEPSSYWNLRKKRVTIPKLGTLFQKLYQILRGETPLGVFIVRLAKYWHISRRETLRSMNFIVHLAKTNPEVVGILFTQLGCPRESIDAFLSEYNIDSKIGNEIKKTYEKYLRKSRLKILSEEEYALLLGATEEKEAKEAEETPIKREELKITKKKSKKKGTKEKQVGTLDYFFKKQ